MIHKVSLVGAGPGDPELLTVKALKRIQQADLIIYDYLANPDHLRHAKEKAVKICVGKGFRYHRLSQERINRLIIREAKNGKKVVRLKGGDPYLFGRGGEEALHLYEHRVPFEVVPGVTSATACAAYAGIPLTHRDHNATVTFLTGHRAGDENLDSIDWEKIIALQGTIVIYMGFYNLGKIAGRLIEKGLSAQTKVSVIEWGTLPRQKSCNGTLQTIEKRARKMDMKPPAMIIIGDVVSLHKQLNWYEKLPLFGKKIVVTRMREKSRFLSEKLTALGAWVLEFPTVEIFKIPNYLEMDTAIKNLANYDWVVFTSGFGVEAFFDRLENHLKQDARHLASVKVACVGPETSQRLIQKGIKPDLLPAAYETQAIVREFKKRFTSLKGKKILLFRTNIAPPALNEGLKKLGASIRQITAYQTRIPKSIPSDVKKNILAGGADFITFTSSSTVSHFVKIIGLKNVRKIAKSTQFASIGPVTSQTLRKYGLKPSCEAKQFTIDGLVKTITENV